MLWALFDSQANAEVRVVVCTVLDRTRRTTGPGDLLQPNTRR